MTHRETVDGEISGVQDPPLRQRDELQRDGCPSLAPESGEHLDDDVERFPGLPWIVMTSALCRSRSVENRPGMPSTWSKWACVSKSRSSLLKPAALLSSWRCVPSPQSIMIR